MPGMVPLETWLARGNLVPVQDGLSSLWTLTRPRRQNQALSQSRNQADCPILRCLALMVNEARGKPVPCMGLHRNLHWWILVRELPGSS